MVRILAVMVIILSCLTAFAGEVKLGALFSETGPASYLGHPEKLTAEMLVAEINAAGGINGDKVVLVSYDTQGDEQRTINYFKRLATKDKVFAVIGPTTTGSSLAVKDLAEKFNTPLISCAASATIVTPVNKYVFKTPQSDIHAAETIFKYMKSKGMKKAAIITAQNGFGVTGRDALIEGAKVQGIEIVSDEKFGDKDKDMTSQLSKIKSASPDAVICWGVGPAPAIVAKNAKDLGIENIFMSHGVASMKFVELAGTSADGLKLPAGRLIVADRLADSDPFKPVLMQYKKDYEGKFNMPVSAFGGHAYDAFSLFKLAYEKSGADKDKFLAALAGTKNFKGTAGEFNMTETDHNGLTSDAFIMVEIRDGKFEIAQ